MTTLHIVPHTHWDREWYLTFQQFRLKLVHLMDGLLDLLAADPDYRYFTLDGQTVVLDDYLAMRPERRGEIEGLVRAGRLLIGPFHILPDEFLVSPEATIRNLLEGDRTARQFGRKMRVGYIPDPFGHIGQMPQILRGFGIDRACLTRGLADEPCELWWEAPDGSRLLLAYQRNSYGNAAGLAAGDPALFAAGVRDAAEALAPYSAAEHLLLAFGTDHQEPQRRTSAAIRYVQGNTRTFGDGSSQTFEDSESSTVYTVVHSTLPRYFDALCESLELDRLPVVRGELRACKRHPLLPGVLSSRMWIKQRNRQCETLLEKWAEPFSVWAEWAGGEQRGDGLLRSPATLLRPAWRLLMECHPHDSICGCSIDQVHAEMAPRFDQVEQFGEEITRQCLVRIAAAVDTHAPRPHPSTPLRSAQDATGGAAGSAHDATGGAAGSAHDAFLTSAQDAVRPSGKSEHPERSPEGTESKGAAVSAIIAFNPSSFTRSDLVTVELEPPPGCGEFELVDEAGAPLPYRTEGLGSCELINMRMARGEFRAAVSTISDGNVAGMKLHELSVTRDGSEAKVEVVLSEQGEANREAWNNGTKAITALLDDAAVTHYVVRARSVGRVKATFVAREVPSCGYRTFWARWQPLQEAAPAGVSPLLARLAPVAMRLGSSPAVRKSVARVQGLRKRRTEPRIENEFFAVDLEEDGTLTVTDQRTSEKYTGLNRFTDGGDCGDEYNYSPPTLDRLIEAKLLSVEVRTDAVTQTIEARLEMGIPKGLTADRRGRTWETVRTPVVTRVSLALGVPRVDIHTEIENGSRDHRLRVHFPGVVAAESAEYDGHFEVVRRPTALPASDETWVEEPRPEAPQRAFVAVTGQRRGLLIANRGLPEAAVSPDGEIAVTLLRCTGWLSRDDFLTRKGHAGPALETPGAQMLGKWRFDYAVVPFLPAEKTAAYRAGWAFETPLRGLSTTAHEGSLPPALSFLTVEPPEFVLSAVKTTENGQGWIARGYNVSDAPLEAELMTWQAFDRCRRVNLAEEASERQASHRGRMVTLPMTGREVATVMFGDGDRT